MEKPKKILIAKYVGYPLFFLLVFLLLIQLMLPVEMIKDRVRREFESSTGWRFDAASVSSGLLGNLVFKDVTLSPVQGEKSEGDGALKLERVSAGIPFGLMLSRWKALAFSVRSFGGELSGNAGMKDTLIKIDVSLDKIDLKKMESAWKKLGVKLDGMVNGSIKLVMDGKDPKKDNGTISLAISDLSVVEGNYMGFELPKMSFGKVTVGIEVKDGKAVIREFTGKGKDIEIKGDGSCTMSAQALSSLMSIKLKFKPTDAFLKQNQKLQPLLPMIQSSKDKDGFYSFQLNGSVGRPAFSMSR